MDIQCSLFIVDTFREPIIIITHVQVAFVEGLCTQTVHLGPGLCITLRFFSRVAVKRGSTVNTDFIMLRRLLYEVHANLCAMGISYLGGLQVTIEHPPGVNVGQSSYNVPDKVVDIRAGNAAILVQYVREGASDGQLCDDPDVLWSLVPFTELEHVLVVQRMHQLYLYVYV